MGNQEIQEEIWLYYGEVNLTGGGVGPHFIKMKDGEKTEETFTVKKQRGWNSFVVGGLYTAKTTNGGNAVKGPPVWKAESYHDKEFVAQIQARDKARTGARQLRTKIKKAKHAELMECLAPIKEVMQNSRPAERAVLLSWAVRELMR